MRATLELPDTLMKEAMKTAHCKTKTGTIVYALKHLVQHNRIQDIKRYQGALRLDIDLDRLRRR
jgi:hypothetical protein